MGLLSRVQDLAKSASQHEADEIRAQTMEHLPVCETPLLDRQHAEVSGVVRSVTMPPRQSVPVLVAELFDGRTLVNLVWIGRRRIVGIEPGVVLQASGRVCLRRGTPTIFNPVYTLVARR